MLNIGSVDMTSRLHQVFQRLRRWMFLLDREERRVVKQALSEYKSLSRFHPTNIMEVYMKRPSDIWEHLATLYMLTVELDLKTILELGTAEGESTIALLQAAHQIGGKVYSIDIDPCQKAREAIENCGLMDHWIFIQGDDLRVKWERSIDHLFIDTTHEFQHTFKELEKYEPYVREGGIITLHDITTFPGVMTAINEYLKNRNDLRLYKYLHNNGLAVIFKKTPHSQNQQAHAKKDVHT